MNDNVWLVTLFTRAAFSCVQLLQMDFHVFFHSLRFGGLVSMIMIYHATDEIKCVDFLFIDHIYDGIPLTLTSIVAK